MAAAGRRTTGGGRTTGSCGRSTGTSWRWRCGGGGLSWAEVLLKTDLDAPNHPGRRARAAGGRPVLKMAFDNVDQKQRVGKEVQEVLRDNKRRRADHGEDFPTYDAERKRGRAADGPNAEWDPLACLVDMREHSMRYIARVCINLDLRKGCWYTLTSLSMGGVVLGKKYNLLKAEPAVLAFNIECTKAPLKFPDTKVNFIYMISYMVDGQGYLILSCPRGVGWW